MRQLERLCLRFSVGALTILALSSSPIPHAVRGAKTDLVASPTSTPTAPEIAQRIDQQLNKKWTIDNVTPADRADDSEFLRRAYLDLAGITPTVAQARRFLADTSPDKRAALIDQLLASPRHAQHMATVWRRILLPDGLNDQQLASAAGLQDWLRRQFAANLPYDTLVAEFLVANRADQYGPGVFYTSLDLVPEKLAARTSQVFLGLQIQCAQCHDHPFDDWSQADFWGYAAFFARLEQKTENRPRRVERLIDLNRGEVLLPNTDRSVPPKYPRGRPADESEGGTRRQQLSIWMASRDNPYLAQAAVNRAWAHMFGRGLVEPIDDMGPHNPPSHPELLDELSEYFARSGFDLGRLYRTLANTQAYQLSSQYVGDVAIPASSFARMNVKTLTAEQLYDCLQSLTASPARNASPSDSLDGRSDVRRRAFVARMQTQSRSAAEYDRGVPQALMLMNGEIVNEMTDPERGRLLLAATAPFLTDKQRVEIVYLATLSRYPGPQEQDRLMEHVAQQATPADKNQALGDILWSLINSAEYTLNH